MTAELFGHPAFLLAAAAVALPLLPLGARRALTVIAPGIALAVLPALPAGESGSVRFLGISLVLARVDALSLVFAFVFLAIAFAGNLYGWHRTRLGEQAAGLLYAAGGLAVVLAGDLLSMFGGWEVMAVASAFLVAAGRRAEARAAAMRYLMVHLAAGGALLIGILLVIRAANSTVFGELNGLGIGAWLVLASLCLNAAVPPLHAWLPDAYPEASPAGSVFLSAFTTKAAVYCLIRAFPGHPFLMWAGAAMAVYGVAFAVLENNIRRLLAYHIVSQVGYMVCGVGVGSALALDGSAAHAFCHILYKGLLFMGAGAVAQVTGRDKLIELGGLYRRMPLTLLLYMVGALSISGAPLFNGFISKSLVVAGAAEMKEGTVVLLLHLASVGTFLSVGLKLPYFAWFAQPAHGPRAEAPRHMLAAMGLVAGACIALGVAPQLLYSRLPYPVSYRPYAPAHVWEAVLMLAFTAAGFGSLRHRLRPHAALTLDADWFYRLPAARFVPDFARPLEHCLQALGAAVRDFADALAAAAQNPPLVLRRLARGQRAWNSADNPQARGSRWVPPYDENRQRPPVALTLLWVLTVFTALAFAFGAAAWCHRSGGKSLSRPSIGRAQRREVAPVAPLIYSLPDERNVVDPGANS